MGERHRQPTINAPSVGAAVNALRSRGMRISTARRRMLERLFAAERPLTAEEIAGELEIGSVYRNLDVLKEVGLVRHVHLGHGPGRYTLTDREYAMCEHCGEIQILADTDLDPIRTAVSDAVGIAPDFSHFPLIGLCAGCSASCE